MRYAAGRVADMGLQGELERIAGTLGQPEVQFLVLKTYHAAPAKPQEGQVVLADGTDWDPGSGAGVYCYYGAAWNRLG